MSEELPTPPHPGVETDESIQVPPPRKRARRKSKRQLGIEAEYKRRYEADLVKAQSRLDAQLTAEHQMHSPMPPPPPSHGGLLTLADIQAAKAIIAQAEAALGVVKPKGDAPAPTHPQKLEDPALGDKTPAVVEWYHKNDPEEYRRRYSGRKTHMEDRRKERPYEPLGASPEPFPADPDGFKLSQTDDSGRSPRVL